MLCLRPKFALSLPLLALATGLAACSSEVPPPVFVPDASLFVDVPGQDVPGAVDRGPATDGQPMTDTVAVTDNGVSEDRGAVVDSGMPGQDATVNTDNGIPGTDVVVSTDNGIPGTDVIVSTDNGIGTMPDAMVFPGDNGIGTMPDAMVFPGDNGIGTGTGSDVVYIDNGIGTGTGSDVVYIDNGIGTGGDAGSTADAGAGNRLVGGRVSSNGVGVPNATVTVVDRPGATVVTGGDGSFSFPLPIGSSQLIRLTRADTRTFQESIIVPTTNVTTLALELISNAAMAEVFTLLSLSENSTQGIIILYFNVADVSAHPGGFGATLNVTGGVRVVLTETGGASRRDTTLPNESSMLILNVPTGPLTVTATTPAGRTCSPAFGTTTTRVDARAVTRVTFDCR